MIEKWELLKSEAVYENPFISVLEETLKCGDGRVVENYYAIKRRDAVYAIALTKKGEVPLVFQYKNGVKDLIWELPAGFVEETEGPLESAKRELAEETGYICDKYIALGQFTPNPSLSGNKNYIFLGVYAEKKQEQNLDKNEEIEVKLFDFEQLVDNIKKRKSQFVGSQDQLGILLAYEELKK